MTTLLAALLALGALAFWLGQRRALAVAAGGARLRARTVYYGHYVALWCVVPALAVVLFAAVSGANPRIAAASLALAAAGAWFARSRISPTLNARVPVESALRTALGDAVTDANPAALAAVASALAAVEAEQPDAAVETDVIRLALAAQR